MHPDLTKSKDVARSFQVMLKKKKKKKSRSYKKVAVKAGEKLLRKATPWREIEFIISL